MKTQETTMIGKNILYQNKDKTMSGKGKIWDKILSKGMNYYIIDTGGGHFDSIPCHWVYKLQ